MDSVNQRAAHQFQYLLDERYLHTDCEQSVTNLLACVNRAFHAVIEPSSKFTKPSCFNRVVAEEVSLFTSLVDLHKRLLRWISDNDMYFGLEPGNQITGNYSGSHCNCISLILNILWDELEKLTKCIRYFADADVWTICDREGFTNGTSFIQRYLEMLQNHKL
jgi:hypothetical protein